MPHTVKGEVGNPYVSHQDPNNDFQKVNHVAIIVFANVQMLIAVVFDSPTGWVLHDLQPCHRRFPGCFCGQCRERDSSDLSV